MESFYAYGREAEQSPYMNLSQSSPSAAAAAASAPTWNTSAPMPPLQNTAWENDSRNASNTSGVSAAAANYSHSGINSTSTPTTQPYSPPASHHHHHHNNSNTDNNNYPMHSPAAGLHSTPLKSATNDGTPQTSSSNNNTGRIAWSDSLPRAGNAPFSPDNHNPPYHAGNGAPIGYGIDSRTAYQPDREHRRLPQTTPYPLNAAVISSSVASHPSGAPSATRSHASDGYFQDPHNMWKESESPSGGGIAAAAGGTVPAMSDTSNLSQQFSSSRAAIRESKRPSVLSPLQAGHTTGSTPVGSHPAVMQRGSRTSLPSAKGTGLHTDVPFSSSSMDILTPPSMKVGNFTAELLPHFNANNGPPQLQPLGAEERENSFGSGSAFNNSGQRMQPQMNFGVQTPASTSSFASLQPRKLSMHPSRPSEGKRVLNMKHMPSPGRDLPCGAPTHGMPPSTREPPLYYTDKPHPPLSYTRFAGVDNGNASPKFFRPSVGSFPATAKLAKECGIPLGATLSPLFQPLENMEKIPVISARQPMRCKGCRGYICSHSEFRKQGLLWRCSLCGVENDVSWDDSTGMSTVTRQDKGMIDKEELLHGSVEYDVDGVKDFAVASHDGTMIPPRPLQHLFLIDISTTARKTFLADYADTLRTTLQEMAAMYPKCEVSFITYASTLHFYNFGDKWMPQLIMSDTDNPFLPLPFSRLCWMQLERDLSRILYFVDHLVKYSADVNESGNVFGAAIQAASLIFARSVGGRIISCTHSAPSSGVGAIVVRDAAKLCGTSKEKELFRPQESFWSDIAKENARGFVAFDLFLFADNFSELITMGQLARITNGMQHQFSAYNSTTDKSRVRIAMEEILLEEAGYAAVLRVRCGRGVRMAGYRGHFQVATTQDMDLSNVQASSSFAVTFSHDSSLDVGQPLSFQAALLYTTRDGHRRVRVHSYRMPVISSPVDVFASVDLEALLHLFVHETLKGCANRDVKGAIGSSMSALTSMLQAYRKHTPSTVSASQYIPDMVDFLPIFLVCLFSSGAMTEGTAVIVDRRTQLGFELGSMPLPRLLRFLYPPLYAVHDSVGGQQGEMSPWLRRNSSINTPARSSWSAFPAAHLVRMASTASIPQPTSFGNHSSLSSPRQSLAAEAFPQTPSIPGVQRASVNTPVTPQWTSPFTAAVQDAGDLGPDSLSATNRDAENVMMMEPLVAGDLDPNTNTCVLPPTEQLTANTVMKEGVYLLVDEQAALVYLWIGSQVTSLVLQELFIGGEYTHPQQITQEMIDAELSGMTRAAFASNGTTSRRRGNSAAAKDSTGNPRAPRGPQLNQSGSFSFTDVEDETPFCVFSPRLRHIVDALTTRRTPKHLTSEESAIRVCRLILLHEGHANEAAFFNLLMEDKYFPTFTGQEELLKHLAHRNGELRHRAGLLSGAE